MYSQSAGVSVGLSWSRMASLTSGDGLAVGWGDRSNWAV